MTDVEVEREACAKQVEGRGILHRAEGRVKAAAEAFACAAGIRERSLYPQPVAAGGSQASVATGGTL